jgi:hypothetical protein
VRRTSWLNFLLPQIRAPEQFVKRGLYLTIRLAHHCVAGDQGNIEAGLEPGRRQAHDLAKHATDPVTHDGATQAPTRYKAIPIVPKRIGRYSHRRERMLPGPPLTPHTIKFGTASEAIWALHNGD